MVTLCSTPNLTAYDKQLGENKSLNQTVEGLFKQKTKMDFATYYKKHRSSLVWYLQRYTNDSYVAEDVADEAFVKALEELERYDSQRSQFSTWLFTIAKRLIYQNTRYESRFQCVTSTSFGKTNGEESEATLDEALSYYTNVRSEVDVKMEEEKLSEQSAYATQHMRKLPSKYSTVLTMRLIDGLSYQEIADYLNANLSTVKSRMREGKRLMRNVLTSHFEDCLFS